MRCQFIVINMEGRGRHRTSTVPSYLEVYLQRMCENDREMNRSTAVMVLSSITILSITQNGNSHTVMFKYMSNIRLRLSCSFTTVIRCVRCESTSGMMARAGVRVMQSHNMVWYTTRFSKLIRNCDSMLALIVTCHCCCLFVRAASSFTSAFQSYYIRVYMSISPESSLNNNNNYIKHSTQYNKHNPLLLERL